MVEVMVARHREADRLAGDRLPHRLQHRVRARVAERRLEQDHVVAHLDGDAVVRPAVRRTSTPSAALSTVTSMAARAMDDGTVTAPALTLTSATFRSSTGNPPCSGDAGGELHPAIVLVVAVGGDHRHIAQDGVIDPRLHLLDQVAGADCRPRAEPAFPHDLEGGAGHRRLVGDGGLHDAVRADPQVVLVGPYGGPGGAALRVDDVPGLVAAHAARPAHLADRGNRAAALRLGPAQVVVEGVRRARVVVRADVAAEVQLRPRLPGCVGLPDSVRVPTARDLNAVELGDAHRLRHGVEVSPRDRRPHQDRHHGQSDQPEPRCPHGGSSTAKRTGFEVARREPVAAECPPQARPYAKRPGRPDCSRRNPESTRRLSAAARSEAAPTAPPVRGLDRRGERPRGRRVLAPLR